VVLHRKCGLLLDRLRARGEGVKCKDRDQLTFGGEGGEKGIFYQIALKQQIGLENIYLGKK